MARIHYLTKESIQNMKEKLLLYKNFIHKQSTIARIAKAENIYTSLNHTMENLEQHLDLLGESLSTDDFNHVLDCYQSFYENSLRFKTAVLDAEVPAMENAEEDYGDAAVFFERMEYSAKLDEIVDFARSQHDNFTRIQEREARDADANFAAEQRLLDEADSRTLIKGSQEKLRGIAPHGESGYGVLYDTITECIRIIDADDDLQTLAGEHYSHFKTIFENWKKDVERLVHNGEYTNPDNDTILKLYVFTKNFFDDTKGYTQAFDEMNALIEREISSMNQAIARQDGILIRDLLNHRYPVETPDTVRARAERDVITADSDSINNTYFSADGQRRRDIVEMQRYVSDFMMNFAPYRHNNVDLSGEALRNELKKYETFSFAEITRVGNEATPLLAKLFNKGITADQLIEISKNPESPKNQAIVEIMKETRTEILDMAMTDDIAKADDKISDLIVETLSRLEKNIEELIKNPTNENISKFSIDNMSLKSFLEQGLPQDAYNENGEEFIRASVDRKLREAGKPYNFEQIYGIINSIGVIETGYKAVAENGTVDIGGASIIANQLFLVKNYLANLAKMPSVGDAIASFTPDINNQINAIQTQTNDTHEELFFEENKGIMADTLFKLGINNISKFVTEMEAQRMANGASDRFAKVIKALKDVETAEKRGFKQVYVNALYNELKKQCNAYLDHRNPWGTAGVERYKLITRIASYVDSSRTHRLNVAAMEREANREVDMSFREINRNFLSNTNSIFGDSDQMKEIKAIAKEIATNQFLGMEIPADGGDVNWYKLIKACANYLSNPKKADNARRAAVRELMANAVVAGHFDDEHLIRALAQSAPEVEDGRRKVNDAIMAYETARDSRINELAARENSLQVKNKNYNDKLDSIISSNMNIVRMAKGNENDLYVDSIFGLNPQQEAMMKERKVYSIVSGVEEYQPRPIELSELAKKGLENLGLTKNDFACLAYMDFSLNSYIVDAKTYKIKSEDATNHISGMVHENIAGYNFRENILNSISVGGNAFKAARENMLTMLEYVGLKQPADIRQIADLMGQMLKLLRPALKEAQTDGYTGEQFFIKRIMKIAESNLDLKKAILDSKHISKKDYRMMKGFAESADIQKEAALAKIKVASAIKSGYVMPEEERINCYKAILKAGIIWTENRTLFVKTAAEKAQRDHVLNQKLVNTVEEYGRIKARYEEALRINPDSDQTRELKVRFEALDKQRNDLTAAAGKKLNSGDVSRPIVTFIGKRSDKDIFDSAIKDVIPKNITMDDLIKKCSKDSTFMDEYMMITSKLADSLNAHKDNPEVAAAAAEDVNVAANKNRVVDQNQAVIQKMVHEDKNQVEIQKLVVEDKKQEDKKLAGEEKNSLASM